MDEKRKDDNLVEFTLEDIKTIVTAAYKIVNVDRLTRDDAKGSYDHHTIAPIVYDDKTDLTGLLGTSITYVLGRELKKDIHDSEDTKEEINQSIEEYKKTGDMPSNSESLRKKLIDIEENIIQEKYNGSIDDYIEENKSKLSSAIMRKLGGKQLTEKTLIEEIPKREYDPDINNPDPTQPNILKAVFINNQRNILLSQTNKKFGISNEGPIKLDNIKKNIQNNISKKDDSKGVEHHEEKKSMKREYNSDIKYGQYEYTFVMSDIHADFRRFIMTMIKNKIIMLLDNGKEINDYDSEINNLISNKFYIYDLVMKYTIKFKKPSCNLIILGDLVDGQRLIFLSGVPYYKEVTDPYGIFEYLLLIILYNLRISAKKIQSRVDIVLGNHELLSLFGRYDDDKFTKDNFRDFVHLSAKNVFGDYQTRLKILAPFFLIQPSLFVQLVNRNDADKLIAIMLHGSFSHDKNPFTDITKDVLDYLNDRIKYILYDCFENNKLYYHTPDENASLQNILKNGDDNSVKGFMDLVANSRLFAEDLMEKDTECVNIKKTTEMNNIFIVMGHCPMQQYVKKQLPYVTGQNGYTDNCDYKSCTIKDCVFIGCVHNNSPRMIVVDNGLSEANVYFSNDNISNKKLEKSTFEDIKLDIPHDRGFKEGFGNRKDDFGVWVELLLLKPSLDQNRRVNNEYDFYRIRTDFNNRYNDIIYYKINTKKNTTYPSCSKQVRGTHHCPSNIIAKGGDYNAYREHKQAYITLCSTNINFKQ